MIEVAMKRRAFLALSCASLVAACTRVERCATCGMRIDPKSTWRADLVTASGRVHFDTPRCALVAWRTGKTAATSLEVAEFYEQHWGSGELVRFVVGSDVVGPMGTDLVPVAPDRVAKFMSDHHGRRALALAEVTPEILSSL
jgi:copper chaperone NosL